MHNTSLYSSSGRLPLGDVLTLDDIETFFDDIADTYIRASLDGEVIIVSEGVEILLGYNVMEVVGRRLLEFQIDPRDLTTMLEALEGASGTLGGYRSLMRKKDGRQVWVSTNYRYFFGPDGRKAGVEGISRDISDDVLANEQVIIARNDLEEMVRMRTRELEDSIARFKDFTAAQADRLWETDAEHNITFATEPKDRETFVDMSEFIGVPFWNIAVGKVTQGNGAALQNIMDSHEPFRRFHLIRELAGGRKRHLRMSGVPVFDDAGEFCGYRGATSNETKFADAQDEADQARSLLFDAFEGITGEFALWDADKNFVMCNDKYRKSLPLAADILKPGLPYEAHARIIAITHYCDEDSDELEGLIDRMMTRLDDTTRPFEVRGRDGKWQLIRNYRTLDGGTFTFRTNISQRKEAELALAQSEQRFRDFTKSAADRYWETDVDHRFTYLSDAPPGSHRIEAERFLGKTRWEIDQVQGSDIDWVRHRSDLDGHRAFNDFRYSYVFEDGTVIYLRVSGVPVFAEDGGFQGYRGTVLDETETVEARKISADIQTQFFDAIDNASDGIVLWGPDERLVMCNSEFRNSNAAFADKLVPGTKFEDFIRTIAKSGQIPEAFDEPEDFVADRLKNHRSPGTKYDGLIRGDRIIQIRRERLPDGSVIAFNTDVTERRHAEERFRTVMENATVGNIVIDGDGRIETVNSAALKIFGYEEGEMTGRNVRMLMPEPDRSGHDGYLENYLQTGQAKIIGSGREVEGLRKGGEIFPMHLGIGEISSAGKASYVGSVLDLTKLKEAEAQLRQSESRLSSAQDIADLGYFERDMVTGEAVFSDVTCEIFGIEPGSDMRLEDVMNLVHPDDRDQLFALNNAFTSDGEPFSTEYRIIRPDGGSRIVRVSIKSITNDQGARTKAIGTLRDITEEKRMDDQLRQAQKMEAVGQLTGGIAHDFNNILAGLQGNLDLIGVELLSEENFSAEECARRVDLAKAIVQRGAHLTKHLLAFSRRQTLRPKATDLHELIDNMLDLMRRALGETVLVGFDLGADLWPALIDPHQLENANLNLAINARDAMPDGGALSIYGHNIEVDAGTDPNAFGLKFGDYVAISVHDTGHGIPEDQLNNVFDPFFTTKDVGEGSGLGLSMVYGFVKQSGGYVAIDSSVGVGTKVTLYLPRTAAIESGAGKTPARARPAVGDGERIMVIEDDPDVRDVTTAALMKLGYFIIDGGDGSKALQIGFGQDEKIDLLLTDVVLPHGNSGPELAKALSEKWREMKVLMMTGYAESQIAPAGDGRPQFPLIQKPFQTNDLSRQIRDMLAAGRG